MSNHGELPGRVPPSGSVAGLSPSATSTKPIGSRNRLGSNEYVSIMRELTPSEQLANMRRITEAAMKKNNNKNIQPLTSSNLGRRERSNSTNSLYSTGPRNRSESIEYVSIMDDETNEEKMAFMKKIAEAAMKKNNKNEQPPKSSTPTTPKTPSVSNGSGFFGSFFSRLFPTSTKPPPSEPTPTKGGRRLSKRRKSQLKKRKRKTHRRRTA